MFNLHLQFLPSSLKPDYDSRQNKELAVLDTVPTSFIREPREGNRFNLIDGLHVHAHKPTTAAKADETEKSNKMGKHTHHDEEEEQQDENEEDHDQDQNEDEHENEHNEDAQQNMKQVSWDGKVQYAHSRNPDKGMTCFVGLDDPIPLHHPRGVEYPHNNPRGARLVKLLIKLFSIIPSKFYIYVLACLFIFVYFLALATRTIH